MIPPCNTPSSAPLTFHSGPHTGLTAASLEPELLARARAGAERHRVAPEGTVLPPAIA
ncbi:MAG: hypothetical protein QF890_16565 [Myxococcota bacterium]|nr:hypothetical protein [Myxococcota bacterium]MDP7434172.1 hypothetical protein [Myxococcota bacterium]